MVKMVTSSCTLLDLKPGNYYFLLPVEDVGIFRALHIKVDSILRAGGMFFALMMFGARTRSCCCLVSDGLNLKKNAQFEQLN